MSIQEHTRRYHFLASWKWFYFFYQLSVTTVLISFILFWSYKWPQLKDSALIKNSDLKKSLIILMNTVPLFTFLIEHYTVNLMPMVPRHLPAVLGLHMVYLGVAGCVNGLVGDTNDES